MKLIFTFQCVDSEMVIIEISSLLNSAILGIGRVKGGTMEYPTGADGYE